MYSLYGMIDQWCHRTACIHCFCTDLDVLYEAKLLRVPERIQFRLAVLVFRYRNQTAPEYLARNLQ